MRITTQNARVGISRHNDRDFDLTKATHIDCSKSTGNVQYSWRGKETEGFEADEKHYFEKKFEETLLFDNEKKRKQGHASRMLDMDAFMVSKRNRPEESIYQIGDKDSHVDAKLLYECYKKFLAFQSEWNKAHGKPFQLLNFALHADEATPHIHQRRLWKYTDENGLLRIGQEKALKQAGVQLPNADMPEGRYNNRKMTFDAMMREKWLDIVEEHGIVFEREPLPNGRHHQTKEEYIRTKYNEMVEDTKELKGLHNKLVDVIEELQEGAVELAYDVIENYEKEKNTREER